MVPCDICGRSLKTGRKYCYVCRSIQHARSFNPRKKKNKDLALNISISLIMFWIFYAMGLFRGEFFKSLFRLSLMLGIPIIILTILKIRQNFNPDKPH